MAKSTVKRLDEGQHEVRKMDLEQAMQEIFYHGFVFTLRPKKALEALKVIRKTLLDYEQLKADYIEIDMQLRTANTENDELKQMLRLAVDTMDNGSCSFDCQKCERLNYKGGCGYDGGFKWKNHDEAMKLLGGTESVD